MTKKFSDFGFERADEQKLNRIAEQLSLMADMSRSDVFIDCVDASGRIFVVAQARPKDAPSVYEGDIAGEEALEENEPAVFRAFQLGIAVRDVRAKTQENRVVRQDVVPILSEKNRCIALLIRERDISRDLARERKFHMLEENYAAEEPSLRQESVISGSDISLRESYHRIKNNLQLLSSMMSMQARRAETEETKKILHESIGRILSIASIHDIICQQKALDSETSLTDTLTLLLNQLKSLIPEEKRVSLRLEGDEILLPYDAVCASALAVNELVCNALEHAFDEKEEGNIVVSIHGGSLYHTVTVADDGCGFDVRSVARDGLGMRMIEATVKDRLHGSFFVRSDENGTAVSFEIAVEK